MKNELAVGNRRYCCNRYLHEVRVILLDYTIRIDLKIKHEKYQSVNLTISNFQLIEVKNHASMTDAFKTL